MVKCVPRANHRVKWSGECVRSSAITIDSGKAKQTQTFVVGQHSGRTSESICINLISSQILRRTRDTFSWSSEQLAAQTGDLLNRHSTHQQQQPGRDTHHRSQRGRAAVWRLNAVATIYRQAAVRCVSDWLNNSSCSSTVVFALSSAAERHTRRTPQIDQRQTVSSSGPSNLVRVKRFSALMSVQST